MKTFPEIYAENMEKASIRNPGKYLIPKVGNRSITGKLLPSTWYELALKMCLGILNDTATISSVAINTAAKMGYKKNIDGVKMAILDDILFGGDK